MIKQIGTEKQYKQGTLILFEKKVYQVTCSICLKWLYGKSGYLTIMKEIMDGEVYLQKLKTREDPPGNDSHPNH